MLQERKSTDKRYTWSKDQGCLKAKLRTILIAAVPCNYLRATLLSRLDPQRVSSAPGRAAALDQQRGTPVAHIHVLRQSTHSLTTLPNLWNRPEEKLTETVGITSYD
ncbi:Protein of unknown function [Gryllus bimaculatus]|nr:Protein of unknown function [Gryllus bimaculatus]